MNQYLMIRSLTLSLVSIRPSHSNKYIKSRMISKLLFNICSIFIRWRHLEVHQKLLVMKVKWLISLEKTLRLSKNYKLFKRLNALNKVFKKKARTKALKISGYNMNNRSIAFFVMLKGWCNIIVYQINFIT